MMRRALEIERRFWSGPPESRLRLNNLALLMRDESVERGWSFTDEAALEIDLRSQFRLGRSAKHPAAKSNYRLLEEMDWDKSGSMRTCEK